MTTRAGAGQSFCLMLSILLAILLAGCQPASETAQPGSSADATSTPSTPTGIGTWTVGTPPPQSLYLELSKTTVHPGQVISRTIHGAHQTLLIGNDFRTDIVGPVMFLEQYVNGSWRLIYYVGLGYHGQKPGNFLPGPNVAIQSIGLAPDPATIKIPAVPSGTYRLREDVEREDDLTPLPATPSPPVRTYTLYITIHVVAVGSTPASP